MYSIKVFKYQSELNDLDKVFSFNSYFFKYISLMFVKLFIRVINLLF